MKQSQHIIPQVYLKEFGYIDSNKQWRISTLDLSTAEIIKKYNKRVFDQKSIESITTEINYFDIPAIPSNKLFEELNGKIETKYPELINELNNNSELSSNGKTILIHIISNLLCRTYHYRELVNYHLTSPWRDRFLKSICSSLEDKATPFINSLKELPIEVQLNMICMIVMDHILNKLSTFRHHILKDYANRGWITSDNPVVLKNPSTESSIFSINTEVVFPLSKDYCAILYHQNATMKNSILRELGNSTLISPTEELYGILHKKIGKNARKYIFFPGYIRDPPISIQSPQ